MPGALLVLIGVLGLWFVSLPVGPVGWGGGAAWRGGFASNGERIYYTGVSGRTGRIPFEGGPMWLWMHGSGCASCHGPDGKGGVPVMGGTKVPSDIRYFALTEGGDHKHEGEGEHPPYNDALIGRAVTQGFNPAGKPLDWTMPRWQMTKSDLEDLLSYLKSLR
jgi:mono/diheme cytochrome c family protein